MYKHSKSNLNIAQVKLKKKFINFQIMIKYNFLDILQKFFINYIRMYNRKLIVNFINKIIY